MDSVDNDPDTANHRVFLVDNSVYSVDTSTAEKCVKCNFTELQQDNLQNDKNRKIFASKIAEILTKYVNSR